jgi:putative DNA primase/helicase
MTLAPAAATAHDAHASERSVTAPLKIEAIPAELRQRGQWVLWRREWRRDKSTKVPYTPGDQHASSTDPDTWSSFDRVLKSLSSGVHDGIGYVFAAEDPYAGVDLDHCRNCESGVVDAWASAILRRLDSWAHWSPSGEGAHIIVQASLPGTGRKTTHATGAVEMYDRGRYFTINDHQVPGTPCSIESRGQELLALYAEVYPPQPNLAHSGQHAAVRPNDLDDQRLLELAFGARNGTAVAALWNGQASGYCSASEADLALCNHLAFWTGRDSARIDRLFRLSGLWRPKWDERRGELTYGQRTIDVAIAGSMRCFGDGANPSPGRPRPRLPEQIVADDVRGIPPLTRPRGIPLPPLERPEGVPIGPLERPSSIPLEELDEVRGA